ncbi:protein of unknown function [Azospirillum baldaniorum]|uniref:Transposase n=1 Tax=Azospirillum baldaniorum TaxID=1064539 RepID=A0A9P1JPI5_9PROT|nr:protein of unknown function [Azospirillum baldaniorum]
MAQPDHACVQNIKEIQGSAWKIHRVNFGIQSYAFY